MDNLFEKYFCYINNEDTKRQIRQDVDELHVCMQNKLWKAAIVLIGSLIEVALYYHIENIDAIRDAIPGYGKRKTITLNDLLKWAKEYKVISPQLFRLSESIRDYRNLIHPRVQQRLNDTANKNIVEMGYNVFLEILSRINQQRNRVADKNSKIIIQQVVEKICRRSLSDADYSVYIPIIEKYGTIRGTKIIERSLKKSHHE